jgi:hypothetical protein
MSKKNLCIEYMLKNASIPVLWTSIGTPLGLAEWFADGVTVEGDEYTFVWEGNEQTARLLDKKVNNFIRFQWLEDEGTDAHFEIRIVREAITGQLSLLVIDYVPEDEREDLILLWNKQIEVLKRKTGI